MHEETYASKMRLSRDEVIGMLFRLTLLGACTYFGVKWIVNAMDPTKKQKDEAQKEAKKLMMRIGVQNVTLSEYEMSIAAQLLDPSTLRTSWDDIGGLDDVIEEIKHMIILPLQKRHLFSNSTLLSPPKGVLLHGPPGCGKTMIARAIARESGCRFINLQASSLTDKWYGESQKLSGAVFSLAMKIQPSIIFIDEIDSFLRSRASQDHEATAMMKAQFMTLWDGIATDPNCQVMVMGATNRPQDVDAAILRRMPSVFCVQLPNKRARKNILDIVLEGEDKNEDIDTDKLAQETEKFSGSDLKELCRAASVFRVQDYATGNKSDAPDSADLLRPLCMTDLSKALTKMKGAKYISPIPDLD
ncbi:outer mitochondrial transmembrane helix translocase-like [Antedon mediterranea]|uniref:outer mitochondrial transmembrane helix translocase-like n=1 Tax=Antedon mediterranea TaxID=105859 RepID=UPI003AF8FFE9